MQKCATVNGLPAMRPILYYAPGSASFLVHWLLIEFGVEYELRWVDFDTNAQKSPAYLALNPNGVVPTLVVDGVPRHEAPALAVWLAERHPLSGFVPAVDDPRRIAFLQWMFDLANEVQPLARQWWYPERVAGVEHQQVVREFTERRIAVHWQRIDAHLAGNGPYLLGDTPTVPDFHLTMLMRFTRKTAAPPTEFPHLADLARRMKARPSFKTLYEREGLTEWA